MRTTYKAVNAALQSSFPGVELVKADEGYHYFSGADTAIWPKTAVMVNSISQLDVQAWVEEAHACRGDVVPGSDYRFQPYDVLQVKRGGEWLDFMTLRTQDEGAQAVSLVDTQRYDGAYRNFRIARFVPRIGLSPVYTKREA